MKTDTIAAIATAMAPAGIGIIRISGEESLEVADRIFRPIKSKKKVSQMDSHTVHYGYICDGEEIVDEVLLLVMRGPHTYTREDTVEIDTHGGVIVMKRILEVVLKNGARPAEPGEYTKRAFLNGRIDLTQAESVIDIINAKSDNALKSSVRQLQGSIRDKITDIRGRLLYELAFIESALDDPEHYSLDGYLPELKQKMQDIYKELKHLLERADDGRILKEGINTVIVGKPNAGKSSLLNALTGEERAIVTDIAGTTRDTLQESIQLDGVGLNIVDTAGIRDTEDTVERIGVERSRQAMEEADLILYVADSSTPLDENDSEILQRIAGRRVIVLLNKSDLKEETSAEELRAHLDPDQEVIPVSMVDGTGLQQFRDRVKDMFFHGDLSFNDEVYLTNARQKNTLTLAWESIGQVLQSMENQMPEDFLTIDMMNAYQELGKMIGEAVEDDLVDEIFSEFCMGK
ncbi:MAG: tRNA uridine-5-carboxymethylaminomethyl(34) synthesis GTPase MnmE [Eubacterium sp.]|jgi:tRNA modification GTPase